MNLDQLSLSLFICNYFFIRFYFPGKPALVRIPSSELAQDEVLPPGPRWIWEGPALCTGQSRELKF